MSRRTAARLGAVGLVVATLLAGAAGTAVAAPAQPCLLGLVCSPGDPTPSPGPSRAPSTTPTTSPSASPAPPSARGEGAPAPTDAPPTSASGGLLPGLPLPTDALPLPAVPPLDGVLPPGLLPPTPITPAMPEVASDGFVSSGLIGDLTMDVLTVTNFRFLGIVTHPTADGGTIRALRVVVDSTDIVNLGVFGPGPESSLVIGQAPGSANATSGQLTLDFTRLRITVFGVLPIEFSFALPPPPLITIPFLSGTDVDIDFVQVASSLSLPGADIRTGPPSVGSPTTDPTAAPLSVADLVSLASLLQLPELLIPYGFTPEQADSAVASGGAPPTADGRAPPGGLLTGPSPPTAGPTTAPSSPASGPQPADGSERPPLTGLADILTG